MTTEALKELARHKDNKLCFDCGTSGPHQNVCLSFNIFVCTVCAGIHRSFNHVVRTLNMATFTPENVEALKHGGNRRARKHWLANYDPAANPVQPDNPQTIKVFIKQCFEEAKWVHKEGDPKKKKKKKDKGDEAKGEKKKKKKKKASDNEAEEGAGARRESVHQQQQQQQPYQQQSYQQPQQPVPDLLDLFGGSLQISEQPSSATNQVNFYSAAPMPSSSSPFQSAPMATIYPPPSSAFSPPVGPPPSTFPSSSQFAATPTMNPPPYSTPTSSDVHSPPPQSAVESLRHALATIRANSSDLSEQQWQSCVAQALTTVTSKLSSSSSSPSAMPFTASATSYPPDRKSVV